MVGQEGSQPALSSISSSVQGSDRYYNPYIGKGEVLFTGPDGIKNHRVKNLTATYVGHGTKSKEGTGNLDYLWRAAPGTPHPIGKSKRVGEIGWQVFPYNMRSNLPNVLLTMGEFRQAAEDRHTHLYQNPWYPDETHRPSSRSPIKDATITDDDTLDQVCLKSGSRPRTARKARPKTAGASKSMTEITGILKRPKSASSSSSRVVISATEQRDWDPVDTKEIEKDRNGPVHGWK